MNFYMFLLFWPAIIQLILCSLLKFTLFSYYASFYPSFSLSSNIKFLLTPLTLTT